MQRRVFIKSALSAAALYSLPRKSLARGSQLLLKNMQQDEPISYVEQNAASSLDFNGDNIGRPHDILWNIESYIDKKGGEPKAFETMDVVIVGGGIGGLSSAYYLRDKKIALLEQDVQLGGNSKGERYGDANYSIGAAYLTAPAANSPIENLLNDLNILDKARRESSEESTVLFDRKIASPFWQGSTDPTAKNEFKKIHHRLKEISNEVDFQFTTTLNTELDEISAEQWLSNEFGNVHDHIKEYMQLYGWSSFGGSLDELSAFQYLGFLCAETNATIAFPGGNSFIAQSLVQRIRTDAGLDSLRSNCMVLKVTTDGNSISVIYEDASGELKKICASHAIIAAPKFIAKRLVPQMSSRQTKAVESLIYRSYIVANVITKKAFNSPSYELYQLQGSVPPAPSALKQGDRSFTDICFGAWPQQDRCQNGILTLYHGKPFDGARQFLFSPFAHDKHKNSFLKDLEPTLSALNLSANDIQGIRLTRWGHSLPLARTGLLAQGLPQMAAESIQNRIHFANQDNWANPCFETAHQAAFDVVTSLIFA